MELNRDERNLAILMLVYELKYFGGFYAVSVDLIRNGVDRRMVSVLEKVANNFYDNNPDFVPVLPVF